MSPEVPFDGGGVTCLLRSTTRGRWRACVCIKGSSDHFLLVIFVYTAAFRISDVYVASVTLQPSLTLIYVQSCTMCVHVQGHELPPAEPLIKFINLPPCLVHSSGKITLTTFVVKSLEFIFFFTFTFESGVNVEKKKKH